jgi:hypothetical protein
VRRYRALLVGNWHYPDDPANLPDLNGPLNDVSRLAETLADPATGMFAPADVTTLTERASYEIVAEMESFFGTATREDVLLLYYSGHGITADNGTLLLCGRNSRTDRKLATTVSADVVNQMISGCPAAAVTIMLDCCHAGAFKSGDLAAELAGKGRYLLTASRSRDRAPDAEHATGMSRFSAHVLRGLRGEAALPGSTEITLSDLYRYVHRRMTEDGRVIPQRRFDGDGEIQIGRAATAGPGPGPVEPGPLVVAPLRVSVTDVTPGRRPPTEYVSVRRPGGGPPAFAVETTADWLTVTARDGHFTIDVDPLDADRRATIAVRDLATGDLHVVRLAVRVVPEADRSGPPRDPAVPPVPPDPAVPPASPDPAEVEPAADARVTGFAAEVLARLQQVKGEWNQRFLVDTVLHVHPDIPESKIDSARSEMLIAPEDVVLALGDQSLTRTGRVGWAFSSSGFHLRPTGAPGSAFPYRHFAGLTIFSKRDAMRVHTITFEGGGESFIEVGENALRLRDMLRWIAAHVR